MKLERNLTVLGTRYVEPKELKIHILKKSVLKSRKLKYFRAVILDSRAYHMDVRTKTMRLELFQRRRDKNNNKGGSLSYNIEFFELRIGPLSSHNIVFNRSSIKDK